MDDRNGNMYPSREAALEAGVPAEHLVEVEPEIVVVTAGPFKGRRYRRTQTGLVRIRYAGARVSPTEERGAE